MAKQTTLAALLAGQLNLQHEMAIAQGRTGESNDPQLFEGERLADFMIWNGYALTEEIHEATGEFQWKPWVTDGSRGTMKNREAFIGELVDAFHFFMNMLLAASPGMDPDQIAEEFAKAYFVKRQTNIDRQCKGYTGEKDAAGREIDRAAAISPALAAMRKDAEEKATARRANNERLRG